MTGAFRCRWRCTGDLANSTLAWILAIPLVIFLILLIQDKAPNTEVQTNLRLFVKNPGPVQGMRTSEKGFIVLIIRLGTRPYLHLSSIISKKQDNEHERRLQSWKIAFASRVFFPPLNVSYHYSALIYGYWAEGRSIWKLENRILRVAPGSGRSTNV